MANPRTLQRSLLLGAFLALAPLRAVAQPQIERIVLFADTDDDDRDGVRDGEAARLAGPTAADLMPLPRGVTAVTESSALLRFVAGSKPWSGVGKPGGPLSLQPRAMMAS